MATKVPLMTDAYTGESLTIERIEGTPLFRCRGGFDPCEWVSGTEYDRLLAALKRRPDGKTVRKLKCPYKGTEIRIEEYNGKCRATGAFSPSRCIWESEREAEWEISHRNGVAPDFPPQVRIEVGEPSRLESDPSLGFGSTLEGFRDNVERIMR